jgi:hypothetical protein
VPSGAAGGKSSKGSASRGGFDGLQATDGSGSEGGGSGWGAEPAEMGGGDGDGSSRRHAVAVPGALPHGGERERGVDLDVWRVVHGRLEGRRPSHGELGCAGVARRPPGSDARTIKGGRLGWSAAKDRHTSGPMTAWVPTISEVNGPPAGAEAGGSQAVSGRVILSPSLTTGRPNVIPRGRMPCTAGELGAGPQVGCLSDMAGK